MPRYSVGGRPGADTSPTAGHVAAMLWNPSSTKSLRLVEARVHIPNTSTVVPSDIALRRATTGGSPGSTITPDIDNDYARALAPPSGAQLRLAAFSGGQPTLESPSLESFVLSRFMGGAFGWVYELGAVIPPGTGLACACILAVTLEELDWTFVWDE